MKRITIGRDSQSNLRVDERWDRVSNNHAEIIYEDGQLTFIDHSSNGTMINNQKINNTSVIICPGDSIRLANVFDLEWCVIERFFPELRQPTPLENLEPENQSHVGRRTVQLNINEVKKERKTEQLNINEVKKERKTEQFSNQSYKRDSSTDKGTQNSNYGQANEYSQSEIDQELERWNWGAFFCSWLWGAFNGIYWPLLILLIVGIPYIGQVGSLCLCVYLGLNGSKMAWRTNKFHSFHSFKKTQKYWAIGGVIWFVLSIIAYIYILKYTLSIL